MRAAAAIPATSPGLFRTSRRDAALLTLALLQGLGLLTVTLLPTPTGLLQRLSIPLMVAVLLWWDSNTISHNHLHNPLFRAPAHNRAFSLYLSVILGVPQSLWRARHFWHHAILPPPPPTAQLRRPTAGPWLPVELGLIAALWLLLLTQRPTFFLLSYLPGYLLGLGLCQLQGHYEHATAAAGVSHYGWLYNWLFFNDGYHAEHHRHPSEHWTRLPQRQLPGAPHSRFPAVFRPLEVLRQQANRAQARLMVLLELLPLRFDWIRRFMLQTHERAFTVLLQQVPLPTTPSICIVGGGLFPRTVLVLQHLLPQARLTVVEEDRAHIQQAQALLSSTSNRSAITFLPERYDPARHAGFDLLVIPLGYLGDRDALNRLPRTPACKVLAVHDWLWRRRGPGVRISWLLLKRLSWSAP